MLPQQLEEEEDGEAAAAAAEDGVDGGLGHGLGVAVAGDGQLRTAVEGEEAEQEDEAAQTGQRDGVAYVFFTKKKKNR